jgi:uncharacterized protein involved in exopolysaccharide biosynthesis/beta-lactamase regulating signal transducer with metallopeptidase domain
MSTLWDPLQYPLARNIGWTLLHSLWQGAFVGLLFAVVRLLARRASANIRYLAGCICLSLSLAGPVLTLKYGTGFPPHWFSSASELSVPGPDVLAAAEGPNHGTSFSASQSWSVLEASSQWLGAMTPVLAGAWLLGVAVCLSRLTCGAWVVRRVRTEGNEPVGLEWLERLNDLRLRLNVCRPVRLLKSTLVEVPTVVGWLRPVILLPASTIAGLTPDQLETILAHELAHVRRLDYLVNAFQCLVESLMFYHPVVWWISRCIREERENCCDDLVLQICENRLVYARALALLEESRLELPRLAFAASGGSLLNRIRRMLGATDSRSRVSTRQLCGLGLLGLGLFLIAIGASLALAPAHFRATTRIRVEPNLEATTGLAERKAPPGHYDPYFIQTEFEVISSDLILRKVIEELNLDKEWGQRYATGRVLKTPETIQMLRNKIDLRPIRNTSLIEISVCMENNGEAATIANKIAEAYQQYRAEEQSKRSKGGINVLLDRQKEEEAKVQQARNEVDKLREELQINEVTEASVQATLLTAETLRRIEGLRIETQAQVIGTETLLADLKKRREEFGTQRLAQALPTAIQDLLLTQLLEQQALAEQKLLMVRKDYGPDNNEVKKALIQVEDLTTRINERVEGILDGLEAKLASLKQALAQLKREVDNAKNHDFQQASYTRPYTSAKRKLEELEEFKRILQMKIAEENVDLSLPKSIVEIVDQASPHERPSVARRSLGASMILLGLLLDTVGLLLVRTKPAPVVRTT